METVELETVNLINPGSSFAGEILTSPTVVVTDNHNISTVGLNVLGNRISVSSVPTEFFSYDIINNYVISSSEKPTLFITGDNTSMNQVSFTPVVAEDDNLVKQFFSALTDNETILKLEPVIITDPVVKDVEVSKKPEEPQNVLHCFKESNSGEKCLMKFQTFKEYRKHIISDHSDKPHKCASCSESFNHEINLKLHLASHQTTDFKCPVCLKVFSRSASLKSHLKFHEKEDSVACLICSEEFNNQALLQLHMKEHHNPEKPYNIELAENNISTEVSQKNTQKTCKDRYIRRGKKRKRGFYICKYCRKDFYKPSQLTRHERIHTGERPFKCEICMSAFGQKSTLQIHMMKHLGIWPFECHLCSAKFNQKCNLQAHVERLHTLSKNQEKYKCYLCPCMFLTTSSLNLHAAASHGLKRCDFSQVKKYVATSKGVVELTESDNLSKGKLTSVDNVIVLSGSKSKKKIAALIENKESESFTPNVNDIVVVGLDSQSDQVTEITSTLPASTDKVSEEEAEIDMQTPNKVPVPKTSHSCQVCGASFACKSHLERHIRIHTKEKPFKCENCDKEFSLKSNLNVHMRTHSEKPRVSCPVCEKTFSNHGILKRHQIYHGTEVRLRCTLCQEEFETKAERRLHFRVCHYEKPSASGIKSFPDPPEIPDPFLSTNKDKSPKEYKCSICGNVFKRKCHLDEHARIHVGRKAFVCILCNKGFFTMVSLKRHLMIHAGTNKITCGECGKVYSSKYSLRRHMETHSSTRPYGCPVCAATYKSKVSCAKHINTHAPSQQGEQRKPVLLTEVNDTQVEKNKEQSETFTEFINIDQNEPQLTLNGNGLSLSLSEAAMPTSLAQTLSTCSLSSANISQENFGVLGEKLDGHIFTFPEVTKNGLFEPGLDGSIFLQSHNIELDSQALGENVASILHPNQIFRPEDKKTGENIKEISLPSSKSFKSPDIQIKPLEIQSHIKLDGTNLKNSVEETSILSSIFPTSMEVVWRLDTGDKKQSENQKDKSSLPTSKSYESINIMNHIKLDERKDNPSTQEAAILKIFPSSAIEWNCTKCDFTCGTLSEINDHVKLHINYICPLCSAPFSSQTDMEVHVTNEHIYPKSCDKCELKFTSEEALKKHSLVHVRKENCNKCDFSCGSPSELNEHSKVHVQFMCSVCAQVFNSSAEVKSHIASQHSLVQSLNGNCGQKVASEGEVRKLDAALHLDKQEKEDLSKKAQRRKKVQKKRKKKTTQKKTRDTEITKVLSENIYLKKNICKKLSFSEKALRNCLIEKDKHIVPDEESDKAMVEYPNKCQYCPKSFRKPSDLVRHVRVHTGERPYECVKCGKRFALKSSVVGHFATHYMARNIPCHICHKSFSTPGSLRLHMRLHTGSKPFICPICNATFRTSGHKKSHLLSHYRKDALKKNNMNFEETEKVLDSAEKMDDPEEVIALFKDTGKGPSEGEKNETDKIELIFNFESGKMKLADDKYSEILIKDDNPLESFVLTLEQGTHNSNESLVPPLRHQNQLNVIEKHNAKKFNCTLCKKSYSKPVLLEKHMKTHEDSDKMVCKKCNKRFESNGEVELHMLVHSLEHESCSDAKGASSPLLESSSLDLSDLLFFPPD